VEIGGDAQEPWNGFPATRVEAVRRDDHLKPHSGDEIGDLSGSGTPAGGEGDDLSHVPPIELLEGSAVPPRGLEKVLVAVSSQNRSPG
jgi:hypothetical protein